MIVGCYSLHLYCDSGAEHGYQEFPHEFQGRTYADVARQAKRHGWWIKSDRTKSLCPKCAKNRSARSDPQ